MVEPLLEKIEGLERSRRRWKTAALLIASLFFGALLTFGGLLWHERFTMVRAARAAEQEARAQEAVARANAEAARRAVAAQQNQGKKE